MARFIWPPSRKWQHGSEISLVYVAQISVKQEWSELSSLLMSHIGWEGGGGWDGSGYST